MKWKFFSAGADSFINFRWNFGKLFNIIKTVFDNFCAQICKLRVPGINISVFKVLILKVTGLLTYPSIIFKTISKSVFRGGKNMYNENSAETTAASKHLINLIEQPDKKQVNLIKKK